MTYEERVQAMAAALHEDCLLDWQARAIASPGVMLTQHGVDAHFGRAHDLVRRLAASDPGPSVEALSVALHATAGKNHNLGEGMLRAVCQSPGSHAERASEMQIVLLARGDRT